MGKKNKSLYWKVVYTIISLLSAVGIIYMLSSFYFMRNYFSEINQKRQGNIAKKIADNIRMDDMGHIDDKKLKAYYANAMVLNPELEIFHLDNKGKILSFFAKKKDLVFDSISVQPIKKFLEGKTDRLIVGQHACKVDCKQAFSAAPIYDKYGELQSYLYVILTNKHSNGFSDFFKSSHMVRMSLISLLLALLVAGLLGLGAFYALSKRLNQITNAVKAFASGDLGQRVTSFKSKDELSTLGDNFNSMADTIENNIHELESVERLRKELIANVSHDLRTPLAVTQGYIETLQMKEATIEPSERKVYLDKILKSTHKLSGLVGTLFEYSKLEALDAEMVKEPTYPSDIIQELYTQYMDKSEQSGIQFICDCPENLPPVLANSQLLERTLVNLIENAFKFSEKGDTVRLCVSIHEKGGVHFKVIDTGVGIPASDIDAIFERYYTVGRTGSDTNSTGLGLAIVKRVVELHGSTIQVESKEGEGSMFSFVLPIV